MMRKIDYKYFSKAKQIAQVSDFPKVHIGCIAVYQNRIVGIGCNTNKTHPAQKYYNRYRIDDAEYNSSESLLPKLHAEINCLNQLKHLDINFSKVKLYIYRTRKDTNKVNGKKYVGQTNKSLIRRAHKDGTGYSSCPIFQMLLRNMDGTILSHGLLLII